MRANGKKPEIILRDGKPRAVIIDIDGYQGILERLEGAEDLRALEEMRTKPLEFKRLEDFLNATPQVYEVYLERAAEQDLKRLSARNFRRIIPQIEALAENPRPVNCRKISGSRNEWRIRAIDCLNDVCSLPRIPMSLRGIAEAISSPVKDEGKHKRLRMRSRQ